MTVNDVTALSRAVTYPAPTVTAGAPNSVTCSPASGADFPLGDTTVNCSAVDNIGRQGSCSFTITLRHRQLALTTIVAFGDSMTAGENGRPLFIDIPNAYPTFLKALFTERLPAQPVTVVNAGVSGEKVTESDARLRAVLARDRPQMLLLLQGINDLNAAESPQTVANALRQRIETARGLGVQFVLVSTLLPTAPEACGTPPPRCRAFDPPAGTITATNQLIRAMVPAAGAHLVEAFDLFNANRLAFIDTDGLHVRPEGNRALANAFWERMLQIVPPQMLGG